MIASCTEAILHQLLQNQHLCGSGDWRKKWDTNGGQVHVSCAVAAAIGEKAHLRPK